MDRLCLGLALIVLLNVLATPVDAGNKVLVEEQVQQLGEVNEQAVRQIEDLPSHGQVEIKAHVQETAEGPVIEILEKKVTSTATKDEPIDVIDSKEVLSPAGQANKQSGDSQ